MENNNKVEGEAPPAPIKVFNADSATAIPAAGVEMTGQQPDGAAAWCRLSGLNGSLGRLDEAEDYARRAIALDIGYAPAYLTLGNALLAKGSPHEALPHYQTAAQLAPADPVAYVGQGQALLALNRAEEAATQYETAIRLAPAMAGLYLHLGNIRLSQLRFDEAAASFASALGCGPGAPLVSALVQHAQVMARSGALEAARMLLDRICRWAPRDAEAWRALATLNGRLGDMAAVAECCRRVLDLQPDDAAAHVMLGHVCHSQGLHEEAFAHYRRAQGLNPHSVPALNGMGASYRTPQDLDAYVDAYRDTVARLAAPGAARAAFIEAVRHLAPDGREAWLHAELQQCYAVPDVDYQPLAALTARILKWRHAIPPAAGLTPEEARELACGIAADSLFRVFLESTINVDPEMERVLTGVRAALLRDPPPPGDIAVIAAMARQCLNNEFIFHADAAEQARVIDIRRALQDRVPSLRWPDPELERDLCLVAMYERLSDLGCSGALQNLQPEAWSPAVRPLLEMGLLQPLEEAAIRGGIESLGRIVDETSRLVRSQYEENPYPRWLGLPELKRRGTPVSIAHLLRQQYPHFEPPALLAGPADVLIAGGGTGKHPISRALTYRDAQVLAIDISKSSLAYAERMARLYGVTNVRFLQADILELGRLDRRFPVIESVGVLHHMDDPVAGWRLLCGLLMDGGVMSIALYSETARRYCVAAQRAIAREGLGAAPADIRAFRAGVLAGGRPELAELQKYTDFYSASACRDLLFHYKEHRFTLPQLAGILDELGLRFIGFTFGDSKIRALYRERFPEDETMTDLTRWAQFEEMNPDTFTGMYYFWCQKV